MEIGMQSAAGCSAALHNRQPTASCYAPDPEGRYRPWPTFETPKVLNIRKLNIIYRDCITGRRGPFPAACFRFAYNLYYVNLLYQCILAPLSYATVESAAAVSSREGGTTPPSIRSLRTSRVLKSTSVGNSWARGPSRSNISCMQRSSLASA